MMNSMEIIKKYLKYINCSMMRLYDFIEFDDFNDCKKDFNDLNYH